MSTELEKNKRKEEVQQYIEDNVEHLPFIAQFWDIHIEDLDKEEPEYLEFGKYNSKLIHPYPFYKPYSKLINLNIEEE